MVSAPTVEPSVYVMLAVPSLPDTDSAALAVPLPDVRVQFTATPETAFPNWSPTLTTSGCRRLCLTVSVCPLPETMVIADGSPAVAVAGIGTETVPEDAVNVCGPTALPSVSDVDAVPLASEVTVAAPTLPPGGGAKLTAAPATAIPSRATSRTVAGCGS